jgi:hypothetical protein
VGLALEMTLMIHHVTLLQVVSVAQHVKHLVFGAPAQLRSLAGQERGQTIPLGDITWLPALVRLDSKLHFLTLGGSTCRQFTSRRGAQYQSKVRLLSPFTRMAPRQSFTTAKFCLCDCLQ